MLDQTLPFINIAFFTSSGAELALNHLAEPILVALALGLFVVRVKQNPPPFRVFKFSQHRLELNGPRPSPQLVSLYAGSSLGGHLAGR